MTPRRRVLQSIALSAGLAAVMLMAFILPAEYGIDPLGTGSALGLLALREPPADVVRTVDGDLVVEHRSFELKPWESLEIKFSVMEGGSLTYRWRATRPVVFEFHGEPADGPAGFAETWRKGEGTDAAGTAVLPYAGKHGWFFENRSLETVEIELTVAGFYSQSHLFRDGFVDTRPAGANP